MRRISEASSVVQSSNDQVVWPAAVPTIPTVLPRRRRRRLVQLASVIVVVSIFWHGVAFRNSAALYNRRSLRFDSTSTVNDWFENNDRYPYLPFQLHEISHDLPYISTITQLVHDPPPQDVTITRNFYEYLMEKDCLPNGRDCVKCLSNTQGSSCRECASVCSCFCQELCQPDTVEEKFIASSITVHPPAKAKDPTRLIPRIIHQTYFEDVTSLQEKYPNWSRMVQSFQQQPGWEYRFYTDQESLEFLTTHFPPEVRQAYEALKPGAYKADLFRYCVLLIFGGVYADVDILLESALDAVIEGDIGFMLPLDAPGKEVGQRMCLWNGFMAAAPGHPFLAKVIEVTVNNIRNRFTSADVDNLFCPDPELSVLHAYDHLFITGPCILGAAVNKVLGRHGMTPFVPGDLDLTVVTQRALLEEGTAFVFGTSYQDVTAKIPGRTVILDQRKKDMGAHRFTYLKRNILVAATDLDNSDDRTHQEEPPEHYSRTRTLESVYGEKYVFVDEQMADEVVLFYVGERGSVVPTENEISLHPSTKANDFGYRFPSVEERVKYYMGMWYNADVRLDSTRFCNDVAFFRKNGTRITDEPYIFNKSNIHDHPLEFFTNDVAKYLLTSPNISVAVQFGDEQPTLEYPIFAKSRRLDSPRVTMVTLLNEIRHFPNQTFHSVKNDDILWHQKKDTLVWRGSSTGNRYRFDVLSRYFNSTHDGIDMAFNTLLLSWQNTTQFQKFVGPEMTIGEILNYKYLLSLEGNDVASGLKWMLLSNSVVLMAPPRFETWAMEGMLIPYYHYIPLEPDHSDLREKLEWARHNDKLCHRIAKQATDFMKSLYTSPQAKKDAKTIFREMSSRYHTLYGDTLSEC